MVVRNNIPDENGNIIISEGIDEIIHIKLKLKGEVRARNIGTINVNEKRIYFNKKRGKHLLNKANAYGFNYSVLSKGRRFTHALITDEGNIWLMPVEDMLKIGSFLWFKKEGFERQIFITLEQLSSYKF